jgi:hypothetical protein
MRVQVYFQEIPLIRFDEVEGMEVNNKYNLSNGSEGRYSLERELDALLY